MGDKVPSKEWLLEYQARPGVDPVLARNARKVLRKTYGVDIPEPRLPVPTRVPTGGESQAPVMQPNKPLDEGVDLFALGGEDTIEGQAHRDTRRSGGAAGLMEMGDRLSAMDTAQKANAARMGRELGFGNQGLPQSFEPVNMPDARYDDYEAKSVPIVYDPDPEIPLAIRDQEWSKLLKRAQQQGRPARRLDTVKGDALADKVLARAPAVFAGMNDAMPLPGGSSLMALGSKAGEAVGLLPEGQTQDLVRNIDENPEARMAGAGVGMVASMGATSPAGVFTPPAMKSMLGNAAVRGVTGAAEGAAQAVMADVADASAHQIAGLDYEIDPLTMMQYGGGLGFGLGALGGASGAAYKRWLEKKGILTGKPLVEPSPFASARLKLDEVGLDTGKFGGLELPPALAQDAAAAHAGAGGIEMTMPGQTARRLQEPGFKVAGEQRDVAMAARSQELDEAARAALEGADKLRVESLYSQSKNPALAERLAQRAVPGENVSERFVSDLTKPASKLTLQYRNKALTEAKRLMDDLVNRQMDPESGVPLEDVQPILDRLTSIRDELDMYRASGMDLSPIDKFLAAFKPEQPAQPGFGDVSANVLGAGAVRPGTPAPSVSPEELAAQTKVTGAELMNMLRGLREQSSPAEAVMKKVPIKKMTEAMGDLKTPDLATTTAQQSDVLRGPNTMLDMIGVGEKARGLDSSYSSVGQSVESALRKSAGEPGRNFAEEMQRLTSGEPQLSGMYSRAADIGAMSRRKAPEDVRAVLGDIGLLDPIHSPDVPMMRTARGKVEGVDKLIPEERQALERLVQRGGGDLGKVGNKMAELEGVLGVKFTGDAARDQDAFGSRLLEWAKGSFEGGGAGAENARFEQWARSNGLGGLLDELRQSVAAENYGRARSVGSARQYQSSADVGRPEGIISRFWSAVHAIDPAMRRTTTRSNIATGGVARDAVEAKRRGQR